MFPLLNAAGALHALVLFSELFTGEGINIGFSHAVSLISLLSVVAYVAIGRGNRLIAVAALYLAPLASLAVLLPLVLPGQRVLQFGGLAFKAHIVAAMLAYALFTVSAIHALLMASLEKRLHAGDIPAVLQGMPPLLRMERLLFQLLFAAFVLLTATLISGVVFSEALFGKPFQFNHKTVFAVFSWVIFGGLLLGHWRFGWRGLLAIRWTLAGFVLLLLSYMGSKFVLEILLQRP
ncbi:MAG: cytochrome c biogenesis protein CcsA [Betaproteobacteria bacterium]|nr:cytochrome c biogenesis protein CcsA [Betaproteobacteria bacterium]